MVVWCIGISPGGVSARGPRPRPAGSELAAPATRRYPPPPRPPPRRAAWRPEDSETRVSTERTPMAPAPEPEILAAFEAAKGFMPVDEGLSLYAAAVEAGRLGLPLLEVGTYGGRSTLLLADAARAAGVAALTVDHHRGSEEQQPGWDYHDPETVDPELGVMDTLPAFRRTLHRAGLEEHVVALVGRSPQIAALWNTPLALVFVD